LALLCARIGGVVEKPGSVWGTLIEGRSSAEMVDGSRVDFNAEGTEFTEVRGDGTKLGKGLAMGKLRGWSASESWEMVAVVVTDCQ
jgi:hypothetical protein